MGNTYSKNRYREKVSKLDSTKLYKHSLPSILDITTITTLSLLLPVLFSCKNFITVPETIIPLKIQADWKSGTGHLSHLDILTFNDDALQQIDSYQRFPAFEEELTISSQTGKKLLFVCANCPYDKLWWAGISSFSALDHVYAELKDERNGSTICCGKGRAEAGGKTNGKMILAPLSSQVILRSLRCDFSGTSYNRECISDCKIYLTNVNARCSLCPEDPVMPTHIINLGGPDESDISEFIEPDIIFRSLEHDVSNTQIYPEIRFLCYPNSGKTDGPGSPFTRLVIEGTIEGERYWWPVSINRSKDSKEPGIYRNRCYIYDITIKRKGVRDPDTPITEHHAEIHLSIMPWKEKTELIAEF